MKFRAAIGAALVVGVLSPGVSGQPVTVYEEYAKHVQRQGAVATLGDSIFGDRVSLYTGSVEFIQTDVSLPGNDGLQVAVGRRFRPLQESMLQTVGHFADWDLNGGRNRVEIRSPSQMHQTDLAGKSHGGVDTPHTKVSPRNPNAESASL